jgi:hypothetical protein
MRSAALAAAAQNGFEANGPINRIVACIARNFGIYMG